VRVMVINWRRCAAGEIDRRAAAHLDRRRIGHPQVRRIWPMAVLDYFGHRRLAN
jgi:hypothetical protein